MFAVLLAGILRGVEGPGSVYVIKSLKPKLSSGYDAICKKIKKKCSPFISSPLAHNCNKSLYSGIFPDHLKYAEVKSLFKKDDQSKISNYRPISILSSFSRVLEEVTYNQLHEHLNKYV